MPYPKIIRNRYRVGETDNRQHSSYHHEEDIRDFHLPLAALHQRHLHTWGICAGLEVSGVVGANTVTVQPGVAIDVEGRMIVLADNGKAQTQARELTNVPVVLALDGLSGAHYVTLAYGENEQPQPGDTTRTYPVNVQQAPLVRLEAAEGFVDNGRTIILAVVTIDGEQRLAELRERLGESTQRRIVGQTVAEVAFQRPVTAANQVSATLAGQLRALPTGGLQLSVANSTDLIELRGANGDNFAELRIHAHATQVQGHLTLQGALAVGETLQVTGSTELNGGLAVDTVTADNFHLLSATGRQQLLRVVAGNQPQDHAIHLLPDGGNIGIGTTQPGYKLDVQGTLNASELYINGAPFATFLPAPSQWTTLADGIAFPNGNIGIGTATPAAKVQIEAGSLLINGENGGLIVDEGGRNRVGFMKYFSREAGIWRLSDQDFEIGRLDAGVTALPGQPTTFTTDFYIASNGRVGIGTTNPSKPLGIRSSGISEELMAFEDPAGNTKWHINQNLSGSNPGLNFVETGVADGRLFIQTGGNIGIGTVNPQGKLDVQGDIRAGNLAVTGRISGQLTGLDVAPNFTARVRCADFVIGGIGDRGPERRAMVAWAHTLEINHNGDWPEVVIQNLANGSSQERKENIAHLTLATAQQALHQLNPVEYTVKTDPRRQKRSGFIAEEAPNLVASNEQKGIFVDGIVAVLTKIVQQQDMELRALRSDVKALTGVIQLLEVGPGK